MNNWWGVGFKSFRLTSDDNIFGNISQCMEHESPIHHRCHHFSCHTWEPWTIGSDYLEREKHVGTQWLLTHTHTKDIYLLVGIWTGWGEQQSLQSKYLYIENIVLNWHTLSNTSNTSIECVRVYNCPNWVGHFQQICRTISLDSIAVSVFVLRRAGLSKYPVN